MTVLDIIRAHIDAHGLTADETIAIVREWLEDNEYDGLCCEDCGCGNDDLCSCTAMYGSCGVSTCEPGHRVTCAECPIRDATEDDDVELCPIEPTEGGWCIVAGLKEAP